MVGMAEMQNLQPAFFLTPMKTKHAERRRAGFSLVELLVVIMIIGLLASIIIPNLGLMTGQADKEKDKRNAQNIMLAYTTGLAAGVVWPDGDVATQVIAVIAGRHPDNGPMASMNFQSVVAADQVPGTYPYLGTRASGELFFDFAGGQNPAGH